MGGLGGLGGCRGCATIAAGQRRGDGARKRRARSKFGVPLGSRRRPSRPVASCGRCVRQVSSRLTRTCARAKRVLGAPHPPGRGPCAGARGAAWSGRRTKARAGRLGECGRVRLPSEAGHSRHGRTAHLGGVVPLKQLGSETCSMEVVRRCVVEIRVRDVRPLFCVDLPNYGHPSYAL